MGDIAKIGGSILGGIVGGPAGAAIGGGLGSLLGGSSDSASQGQQQAAQQSQQGFNYLTQSTLGTSYLPAGGSATNAISSLLGIGGGGGGAAAPGAGGLSPGAAAAQSTALGHAPGGNNTALQDIRQALALGRPISDASWAQAGFGPGGSAPGGTPAGAAPAGGGAPADPNAGFQNYLNSTGYQFQLGEGQRAIASSNATKGLLNSGATLKALNKYGQGVASQSFNNYLGQLGDVANRGLTAGNAIGGAAGDAGARSASYTAAAGATRQANTDVNLGAGIKAINAGFTPDASGATPFGSAYNYLRGR